MALEEYRRKRDFTRTKEPPPERARPRKQKLSYLIQKHDATRLHYDFRLELDGVLLSWAVTKGPSLSPADKRLAVRTEDHPLSYGSFEGTIPKGQYGGGTVMLWDQGNLGAHRRSARRIEERASFFHTSWRASERRMGSHPHARRRQARELAVDQAKRRRSPERRQGSTPRRQFLQCDQRKVHESDRGRSKPVQAAE